MGLNGSKKASYDLGEEQVRERLRCNWNSSFLITRASLRVITASSRRRDGEECAANYHGLRKDEGGGLSFSCSSLTQEGGKGWRHSFRGRKRSFFSEIGKWERPPIPSS